MSMKVTLIFGIENFNSKNKIKLEVLIKFVLVVPNRILLG